MLVFLENLARMVPNHINFFFFVSVVNLLRRRVVNLERRNMVNLYRPTVVNFSGASNKGADENRKTGPAHFG
jgi:hypothetical protein